MLSGLANPRQAASQLLTFGLILSSAFMVPKPPYCLAPAKHAPTHLPTTHPHDSARPEWEKLTRDTPRCGRASAQ